MLAILRGHDYQIFPRFYFVSNVALLDMLANGTNPPKIMPYLGDCYDSLANLTFVTLEDGSTSTKTVNEMVGVGSNWSTTKAAFFSNRTTHPLANR